MARRIAIALLAITLFMLGGAPPAAAVPPGNNGPIAFGRFIRGVANQIRVVNPDGSFESVVVERAAGGLAWSPDGRRLAYGAPDGLRTQDVYSGTRRRLTSGFISDVSWSPDGSTIVFTRERETTGSDLWTIGAGGGGATRLTTDDRQLVRNSEPDWSPDGSRIVYVRTDNNFPPSESIRIIAANGSGPSSIVESSPGSRGPSWSPDGGRIAFSASTLTAPFSSQIHLVNPDGSGRTQLTALDRQAFRPAWSPGGDRLAIGTSQGSGTNQIWTIDRDGSGARRLPVDGFVESPAWGSGPLLRRRLRAPSDAVLGRSVAASAVRGVVSFRRPGTRRFVRLRGTAAVPMRSLVDTRRGTVRLTSAVDRRGNTQTGDFSAGAFQVLQSRKKKAKGLTSLVLNGGKFNRCGRSKGATAALSKRAIRRLRGKAKGRFRTRGRYSAATVRGTVWTTSDRCDGTLTKVTRGRVVVRDLRRRRNISLRAGRSYLAKAPR